MEDKKEQPTITIETLLEDNKNIKASLEATNKKLDEMVTFNKALLSSTHRVANDNEITKETAMKKIEAYIKGGN